MRVIPRYDAFFLTFYALLIPLAGAVAYLAVGRIEMPLMALLLLAVYLPLALRRPWRRWRALRAGLPDEWRGRLASSSAFYRGLEAGARERFERDVLLFLADTRIAGTGGRPASREARLLVAAGAAVMLHGRADWEPPLRDGVTLYPGHVFDRNYRAGRGNIAGQAPAGGPLLVAEQSLFEGFAGERDGANVLMHELAHYFDLEARKGGLKVVLPEGASDWGEAVGREYREHDFAASVLDPYAAQNEAEFFACASEAFFENPRPLQRAHPRLFSLLCGFYGQDPRAVLARGRS